MFTKRQRPKDELNQTNRNKSNKTTGKDRTKSISSDLGQILNELKFSRETAVQFLIDRQNDPRYSKKWISTNLKALESGDFSPLEKLFAAEKFLGPNGHFIIVAPYKTFRDDRVEITPTGVIGKALRHKKLGRRVYLQISKLIAPLQEKIPHVLPVFIDESFGAAAPEIGEAFLVPTSWKWSSDKSGPALNNLTEQARRIDESGEQALERIFSPESFELLMRPFRLKNKGHLIRNLEYSLHDAGHMSGYRGLFYKLSRNLLFDHSTRGYEEYRADGVDLQLAVDLYSARRAAQIISSNFVTRFAMDAHRAGGVARDFDAVVSLLAFDRLWRSRALRLENGRLAFVNPTAQGLIQASEWQRRDGVLLSRAELHLKNENDLSSLYHEFCEVADESRELFQRYIVEPCRGLYSQLR